MFKNLVNALVALRTPVFIITVGILFLINRQYLTINFVLFFHNTFSHSVSILPDTWHWDYFLFPPNTIIHITCLVFGIGAIELKKWKLPESPSWQADAAMLWACLLLAALPVLFTVKETVVLNLVRSICVQIGVYFIFFALNADLCLFRRFVESKFWFKLVSAVTFPFADIVFYSSHRTRIAAVNRRLKYLPSMFYLLLAAGIIVSRAGIAYGSIRAEKINIRFIGEFDINDTYYSQWLGEHLWFSNTDWEDASAGIWLYRERDGATGQFISIFDPHSFYLEDGYIYLFDRLINNRVLKLELASRRIIWSVQVKGAGSYILRTNQDTILATGELGTMYAIRKEDGVIIAHNVFPTKTDHPEILSNGNVVYLDGEPLIQYLDSNLNHKRTLFLPPLIEHPELRNRFPGNGFKRIASWVFYSPEKNHLYVSAMWGEIYLLDMETLEWIRTYNVIPGVRSITVDEENNLLFAAHFIQGYIEVIDLRTGNQLETILAAATCRHINLDPLRKRGILHTNGRGMFKFDYSEIQASQ